jgi:hypothetical protein
MRCGGWAGPEGRRARRVVGTRGRGSRTWRRQCQWHSTTTRSPARKAVPVCGPGAHVAVVTLSVIPPAGMFNRHRGPRHEKHAICHGVCVRGLLFRTAIGGQTPGCSLPGLEGGRHDDLSGRVAASLSLLRGGTRIGGTARGFSARCDFVPPLKAAAYAELFPSRG